MEMIELNGQKKVISKGMTEFVLNEKYRWYEGMFSGCSIILSTDKTQKTVEQH